MTRPLWALGVRGGVASEDRSCSECGAVIPKGQGFIHGPEGRLCWQCWAKLNPELLERSR